MSDIIGVRVTKSVIEELQIRRLLLRYEYSKRREQLVRAIVWRLPHELVYWSVIRVWAHGTSSRWGNTHPDELNWHQALQRWGESSDPEELFDGSKCR